MQYSSFSSLCSAVLLRISMFLFLIVANRTAAITLPPNVTVPALLAFGDSVFDPGNNNNIQTLIKCNFPPYGQDFKGGLPTGRFTNDRIPPDFIAEELSIKQYVPAYLDPSIGPHELLTGVSFASGASGFDPLTSKIASTISLSEQLEHFKEYIRKVKRVVGKEKAKFILNNSLFIIIAGSDDIATTYFSTPFRRKHYDVDSYTDLMLHYASSFVQNLYGIGARRIAVFSAPPIGCVPAQRTIGGGISRKCVEDYNHVAKLFNSKLAHELDYSISKLPHLWIVYVDIYNPLLDFIQQPEKYGFEEVVRGCCGTGLIEVTVLCNKFDLVCSNDSKYLFWDSYHPTAKAYQILSTLFVEKYVSRLT